MGQFFTSNPAARPAQGPKEGRWSRALPKDWRSALGLDERAAEQPGGEPAAEGEPAEQAAPSGQTA